MANLTAADPVDMTDWNFGNIETGTVLTDTAFHYTIEGADGQSLYHFTGVGLTYNAKHQLTGGVVTGYEVTDPSGNVELSVSGFSLNAVTLEHAIKTGDTDGSFENAVFANNNTITGSAGDDVLQAFSDGFETLSGGDGNDTIIDETMGGPATVGDAINGGNGDDTIFVGANFFDTLPVIDGGAGYDTVVLDGDYSQTFVLPAMGSVEQLLLLGGPHYSLEAADGLVGAGQTLLVDASHLRGKDASLLFDGRTESDGTFEIVGASGSDSVRGGSGNDTFRMFKGGSDFIDGGSGNDVIMMGAKFDATDRLHGGGDLDSLVLNGDYSAGVVLRAGTMQNIETLRLRGGHSYNLTMNDGNVAAGASLVVTADSLGQADSLIFDGSAEKDGAFVIFDGAGDDVLSGGSLGDIFLSGGGADVVNGGGGRDLFVYTSTGSFDGTATLDGGAGVDTLELFGDYSSGITLDSSHLVSVERVNVDNGFDYRIVLTANVVAAGKTLSISGTGGSFGGGLDTPFHLDVDGSAVTGGRLHLFGGAGDDTLTGGAKADTITGAMGADHLQGGHGADTFVYAAASDSTSTTFDTITGFNALKEKFSVGHLPNAIDAAITTGALFAGTFDANLAQAVDAAHLGVNDAVLFTPDRGAFVGDSFLVVDMNGVAGYQSSEDLVIDLHAARSLDITTDTFR